jgi:hypothetical protein
MGNSLDGTKLQRAVRENTIQRLCPYTFIAPFRLTDDIEEGIKAKIREVDDREEYSFSFSVYGARLPWYLHVSSEIYGLLRVSRWVLK